MLSIFHVLVGHLYIISIQMSIQALYLFLNQVILFYFEFIAMSQHLDTREQLVTSH